jgi:hypothetical protein
MSHYESWCWSGRDESGETRSCNTLAASQAKTAGSDFVESLDECGIYELE